MKELNLDDILKNTSSFDIKKRVGFVSIIWRPNVWKSTFLNTILWEKVAIVSKVPQTTRNNILWIYNDNDSQIIFFDTAWIHKSNKLFNEKINNSSIWSIKEADLILYFIDSSRESWEEEEYIQEILKKSSKSFIKVYTKSDLLAKIDIPKEEDIFYISSFNNDSLINLLDKIKTYLSISNIYYDLDVYTKQNISFRISEIIREKIFLHTREEIPHSVYVWIEEIEDSENLLKILAYIYCETDSQKYILIGKWWSLLSIIWKEARLELESIFDKKIFLSLRVKINKNWKKDEKLIKKILE